MSQKACSFWLAYLQNLHALTLTGDEWLCMIDEEPEEIEEPDLESARRIIRSVFGVPGDVSVGILPYHTVWKDTL